jgi:DNA-binding SARP family transcriptional activator
MKHEWADQYQTAIQLLKLIQVDYGHARKELQEVGSHFAEREGEASRQLRAALETLDKMNAIPNTAPQQFMPTLEAYCLGKFQVRVGWKKMEQWRSTKAKSALKYLIGQKGHLISKDILMEALWPGCEPLLANNNLKAAMRALRQTLNLDHGTNTDFAWILFQDGNYMINSEANLWIDVEQFEYHWHSGKRFENEGKATEAIREYKAAEALYKGDYLEDDPYEEWTYLQREALKDEYQAILSKLADFSLDGTDYDDCIIYCQKILAKDPCREDAYRRLMCCYSRLGQRNRAIGWYRLCEKTIKRELEVSPDKSTFALYQKLLNDEYI